MMPDISQFQSKFIVMINGNMQLKPDGKRYKKEGEKLR